MKTKIIGRAFILQFVAAAVLALLGKYDPKAKTLADKDGNPIFLVDYRQGGRGDIGTNGVIFNDKAEDGSAQLTIMIPLDVKDRKKWVVDNFAITFARLEEIEPQLIAAADQAKALEARVEGGITVVE